MILLLYANPDHRVTTLLVVLNLLFLVPLPFRILTAAPSQRCCCRRISCC